MMILSVMLGAMVGILLVASVRPTERRLSKCPICRSFNRPSNDGVACNRCRARGMYTVGEINRMQPRMRKDLFYFAEIMCGVRLRDKQINFAKSCMANYHTVAVFSRQTGKSTTLAILVCWYLTFKRDLKIGCYAPKKETAINVMFKSVVKMLHHQTVMTRVLLPREHIKAVGIVNMPNGNEFRVFTAGNTANVRGYDPDIIICDETQDISDIMYWTQVIPSGSAVKNLDGKEDNSKIWEAGTPRGRNHYYEATKRAFPEGGWIYDSEGEKRTFVVIQPHWESSISDPKKVAWAKENMSLPDFLAEYCCEFQTDIGFVFPWDSIEAAKEGNVPGREGGYKWHDRGVYVAGIDLGKTKDHSVLVVFEYRKLAQATRPGYRMVHFYQWELGLTWGQMFNEMNEMMDYWRPTYTIMDNTKSGDLAYEGFFERTRWMVEPFTFHVRSKMELFRNAQKLFEDGRVAIWNEPKIVRQLEKFEEERLQNSDLVRFSGAKGEHDDIVDALSMALLAGTRIQLDRAPGGDLGFDIAPQEESEVIQFMRADEASEAKDLEAVWGKDTEKSLFDSDIWDM